MAEVLFLVCTLLTDGVLVHAHAGIANPRSSVVDMESPVPVCKQDEALDAIEIPAHAFDHQRGSSSIMEHGQCTAPVHLADSLLRPIGAQTSMPFISFAGECEDGMLHDDPLHMWRVNDIFSSTHHLFPDNSFHLGSQLSACISNDICFSPMSDNSLPNLD